MTTKLTTFQRAYIDAALWSSSIWDEQGNSLGSFESLNYTVDDLAPATLQEMIEDCEDFVQGNEADLAEAGDDEQNGHDFWLTRNGHGAGFWDRGYGEVGERLSAASKVYGGVDLYLSGELIYA